MQNSGPTGDIARSRSFGAAAAAYHRARTGYTDADISWALEGAGPAAADLRVLDLAAGTGRLTLALLDAGVGVGEGGALDAVEPDPAMRAEFARQVPAQLVALHDGTAEAIPLPGGSVDAVVAGSAFHWFDPQRSLPEIARVLRPGGVLAALWTHPDEEVDWVRSYRSAGRASLARPTGPQPRDPPNEAEARHHVDDRRHSDIPTSPLFTPTEQRATVHVEQTTREVLTEAIGTYSEVLVAERARRDAALAAVAAAVERAVPDRAGDPVVQLPVRVRMARCRLR